MQIKAVAKALGLSPEAIRYFEREGLAEPPARAGNGYRSYGAAELERLAFIANCRSLEMSHEEIRELLEAERNPKTECETVARVVQHHMAHVRARIAVLRGLLKALQSLEDSCSHEGEMKACDVMRALSKPVAKRAKAAHTHL
jgi:DNA-binding transcriptional MerR regulator